jgi:hypothetical protein
MNHALEDQRFTYELAHYVADWLNEERHRREEAETKPRDIYAEEILLAYQSFKGGANES